MDESFQDLAGPDGPADEVDAGDAGTPAPDVDGLVALVRRAQRKDPAAFTDLIRRYERIALSVAYATLGGGAKGDAGATSAGDVVQEAFLRAWERLPELKEPARFGSWLCGVVRNLAIDARRRLRTQRAHVQRTDNAADDAPAPHAMIADERAVDPLEALHGAERRDLLAHALESLDEVSRSAVTLRYYDNLSSKQIGELLNLNPTAVDMRLSRARQQLRQVLQASAAFANDGKDREQATR